jgi:hypothetical protein
MASCHIVDLPALGLSRCYVHDQPAPCPLAGTDAPATSEPYHVYAAPDQEVQVATARHLTAGTRPIRVHQGTAGDHGHVVAASRDCWCDFVTIPAG